MALPSTSIQPLISSRIFFGTDDPFADFFGGKSTCVDAHTNSLQNDLIHKKTVLDHENLVQGVIKYILIPPFLSVCLSPSLSPVGGRGGGMFGGFGAGFGSGFGGGFGGAGFGTDFSDFGMAGGAS